MKKLSIVCAVVFSIVLSPVYGAAKTWTGLGEDNLASNAANWDGGVPVSGDDIILNGATEAAQKSVTWDAGMNGVVLASWTQDGYTGEVVFETVFPDKGDFNIVRITGNVLLNSGSWTTPFNFIGHKDLTYANLWGEVNSQKILGQYSLRVEIGGSLNVGENAIIDVIGKGYPRAASPVQNKKGSCAMYGGSYGGPGGDNHLEHYNAFEPYGSIVEPVDLGSGGNWGPAGGAVYLVVTGETVLSGSIKADAHDNQHYPGSGGSVYLKTGTISGKGLITSNSKQNGNNAGSGGRIAVILTADGANWDSFDILNQAEALSVTTKNSGYGMSGTIYAETPANRKDHGWLIMKGNGRPMVNTNRTMRICVSGYNVCDFDRITLTNSAVARFDGGETLVLTNTILEVVDKAGILNGFRFCGGKVHVDGNTFRQKTFVDIHNAASPAEEGVTYEVAAGSKLLIYDTVSFADSIINNGTIELDAANMRIEKNFTNNGTFTMDGDSTFEFVGKGESVVSGNSTFSTLLCYEPGKILSFAPNSVQTVSKTLTLSVASGSPLELKSTTSGSAWKLNVNNNAAVLVQGVNVSDSDASGGQTIMAYRSTDKGNNQNWTISADTPPNSWLGTASTAFEDGANWALGKPPANGEKLVIAAANPMVISSDITFSTATLSGGANVTINSNVSVAGDVEISNATLMWDIPGVIEGNLIINNGGTLTHSANGNTETYRLDLFVKGNVVVNEGGAIDVSCKGFSGTNFGPGAPGGNCGSSYGGRGGMISDVIIARACYGSIYCPTNLGSSGNWAGPGGGSVKLVTKGTLTVNGAIKSNGGAPTVFGTGNYDGTGGSIWLTVNELLGSGDITANHYKFQSSGGRIAVYLTGEEATFDSFKGVIKAYSSSASGTVYLETAKEQGRAGLLRIDNGGASFSQSGNRKTDLPSTVQCDPNEFDKFNRTTLEVSNGGDVYLTQDCHIGDLRMDKKGYIHLNGHTLYIHTRRHKMDIDDSQIIPGGTEDNPGKIVWTITGTVLIVR